MTDSRGRRRVALISSSYHPHFGGVEEHVRHVAAELTSRGHQVEVWTVDRGEHLGVQQVDGITVRYLPTPLPARRVPNLARFGASAPGALLGWLRAARQFRPDVLHVHCFGPNGPYAMAVSTLTRTSLVLTSHGETFMDEHDVFGRSPFLRAALRRGCATAGSVTGVSSLVADDLRRRFDATEIAIIPNGVKEPSSHQDSLATRHRGDGEVVAVGRFVQVKGFDLLLRAAAASDRLRNLRIVGDGPERENLALLVASLHLEDRVEFLGRQTSEEVQRVMSRARVVVMPSRKEAFGIVALEAWASGTPLVATSTGGPAGFVTDGLDGVLVDPRDTAALAAAIDDVLGDAAHAQELAARGRETVRQFTWERVVDRYETIYRSVLAD